MLKVKDFIIDRLKRVHQINYSNIDLSRQGPIFLTCVINSAFLTAEYEKKCFGSFSDETELNFFDRWFDFDVSRLVFSIRMKFSFSSKQHF